MKRVLAIADDFTGAAEIAAAGLGCGLAARVIRARSRDVAAAEGLTVVDTDSRLFPPAEAAEAVFSAASRFAGEQFDLVYKKTDSVLRGPVAAEVLAVMRAFGRRTVTLVPQNPTRGRTIELGRYLVSGVPLERTTFADDPHYPAKTSDAAELAEWSSPGSVLYADAPGERRGDSPLPITIGGGRSHSELLRWANASRAETQLAGGVDFFMAAMETIGLRSSRRPPLAMHPGAVLMACGSRAQSSRDFCSTLNAMETGAIAFADAGASHNADAATHEVARWVDQAAARLQQSRFVALAFGNDRAAAGSQPAVMMGEAVYRLLERTEVKHLWIEGGSTASAVFDRAEWDSFVLEGELAPGVVVLHPASRPELSVVVKPGSYAWPKSAGEFLPAGCEGVLRRI